MTYDVYDLEKYVTRSLVVLFVRTVRLGSSRITDFSYNLSKALAFDMKPCV